MGVKLDMFADEENPRVCEAGEAIFSAFDMGWEMYVVLEGQVELTIDGKVLEILGPGEPFGEMALLDAAPRSASVIALTPLRALRLRRAEFNQAAAAHPELLQGVVRVLAQRLRARNAEAPGP